MRLGVRSALVEGAWVAGDVEVVDGRIAAVGCAPRGSAGVAAPGFVDCQVNGFAGVDLRTAATGDYAAVTAALAATGVTTFLPTLHSSTLEMYRAALAVLGEVRAAPPPGARVGGAHLEGPFLSVRWRGAHDPRLLTEPDPDVVSSLLAAGPVALVTLAPELQGAHPLIAALRAAGVVVSVGHTDATAAQTHAGIDAGADSGFGPGVVAEGQRAEGEEEFLHDGLVEGGFGVQAVGRIVQVGRVVADRASARVQHLAAEAGHVDHQRGVVEAVPVDDEIEGAVDRTQAGAEAGSVDERAVDERFGRFGQRGSGLGSEVRGDRRRYPARDSPLNGPL